MGLFSMARYHKSPKNRVYIYYTITKPQVDLSMHDDLDFNYTQEVRYRSDVRFKYLGYVNITEEMKNYFNYLYMVISDELEPWEEPPLSPNGMEAMEFREWMMKKYLKSIKLNGK